MKKEIKIEDNFWIPTNGMSISELLAKSKEKTSGVEIQSCTGKPLLTLKGNGDILIKGKLIGNDEEVLPFFKALIKGSVIVKDFEY